MNSSELIARERLVVVGNGMVSLRFVERLVSAAPGRYALTVIGAEASPAYNRVLLSALLAEDVDEAACRFRDHAWYGDQEVTLRLGRRVVAIDPVAQDVELEGGERVGYDRLVLATGSNPVMLPLPGADLPGVIAFRDLAHVEDMRAFARRGRPAVVIGGGLLGLEAAYGLARLGVPTTLLHVMDRLMERQLDARGAALVRAAMERKGVAVQLSAHTAALEGEGEVERVRLKDGGAIPAGLVVMAVGVRPATGLAATAGLATARGILVDDELATSAPRVHAIGECAEHRGEVYGLVEPGYEQAEILARRFAGEAVDYQGSHIATSLKVSGLPVFSAGVVADDAEGKRIILSDPGSGIYRKLLIRDGRLVGALLVGDVAEGTWYRELIRTGADVSSFRSDLMFGRPPIAAAPLSRAA